MPAEMMCLTTLLLLLLPRWLRAKHALSSERYL
jgi:hypothetical protein